MDKSYDPKITFEMSNLEKVVCVKTEVTECLVDVIFR
jgi:hypothetical protein